MSELGWGGSNRTLARWSRHVASWTNVRVWTAECRLGEHMEGEWGVVCGDFCDVYSSVGEVGCVRMVFCHFIGVCSFVTDGLSAMVAR